MGTFPIKSWFTSKMNWLGIITLLLGIIGAVTPVLETNPTVELNLQDAAMIVIGILTFILRTYFTNTAISHPRLAGLLGSKR